MGPPPPVAQGYTLYEYVLIKAIPPTVVYKGKPLDNLGNTLYTRVNPWLY